LFLALPIAAGCSRSNGIQGTYFIESEAGDLGPAPSEFGKERTVKFTEDRLIVTLPDGKQNTGTYKLDVTKTPHEIDLVATREGGADERMYGIFKYEGDTLTICYAHKATDRPKEFKATADGKMTLVVFKKR
jgi:uncharacterized protein (TIGR03067 family)